MTQLEELASMVEALQGPSREVDRSIMITLNLRPDYAADWGPRDNCQPAAYAYTASLDAAMTLVPEGHLWMLTNTSIDSPLEPDLTRATAMVGPWEKVDGEPTEAATPALALCAAALRARSLLKAALPAQGDGEKVG